MYLFRLPILLLLRLQTLDYLLISLYGASSGVSRIETWCFGWKRESSVERFPEEREIIIDPEPLELQGH